MRGSAGLLSVLRVLGVARLGSSAPGPDRLAIGFRDEATRGFAVSTELKWSPLSVACSEPSMPQPVLALTAACRSVVGRSPTGMSVPVLALARLYAELVK
jgi:hypothetical protein